jgi:hypothetical protein
MSDYFAGRLADERHAAYMREVEHDELVAQTRRVGGQHPLRRLLITVAAAVALALTIAAPVAADNASYPGCSYFGAVATGDFAAGGALGALISSVAPRNPGVVSGIVQEEHGLYCAPR